MLQTLKKCSQSVQAFASAHWLAFKVYVMLRIEIIYTLSPDLFQICQCMSQDMGLNIARLYCIGVVSLRFSFLTYTFLQVSLTHFQEPLLRLTDTSIISTQTLLQNKPLKLPVVWAICNPCQ